VVTVQKLFYKRLADHYKYQYSVLRTAVDWTIALYIIVPFFIFIGYQYVSWWLHPPGWITYVPYAILCFLLFLFAATGTIRLFVEEGDQLFLIQRPKWMHGVMRLGMMYSLVVHFVLCLLVMLILAPILLMVYKLSVLQTALLGLWLWVMRSFGAWVKDLLSIRFMGWKYWPILCGWFLAFYLFFLLGSIRLLGVSPLAGIALSGRFQDVAAGSSGHGSALLLGALIVLLGIGIYVLAKRRLLYKGTFFHDVEHEQKQRLRLTAFLLRGILRTETPLLRHKTPLLFRNSKPLFKKRRTSANVLAEVCIKSFFRRFTQVKMYAQLVAVGIAAITLLSLWLKVAIWAAFALLFADWLKAYWKEVEAAAFVRMFTWKDWDRRIAASKAVFLIMLPGFLILSAAAGFSMMAWPGAVAAIPVGCLVAYAAANLMTAW